jgi:hypothetical protein
MQSALQLMQEIPDLCFSWSAASTYRWAQEMDPRLAAAIRQRIREGRWEVVGGWIVEPDCNIPSTESFVRQCLYGKRYLAAAFGAHVDVGYNVDAFGHSGGLPQILARAGYRYYVMMRPELHESDRPLPLLFWWESPDGSRVLTWRIPYGYGQGPTTTATALEEQLREGWPDYFAPGFQHGAFFLLRNYPRGLQAFTHRRVAVQNPAAFRPRGPVGPVLQVIPRHAGRLLDGQAERVLGRREQAQGLVRDELLHGIALDDRSPAADEVAAATDHPEVPSEEPRPVGDSLGVART